jgi:hypothetical protein
MNNFEQNRNSYYLIGIAGSIIALTSFVIGKFTTLESVTQHNSVRIDKVEGRIDGFEHKYITKDETLLRLQQIEVNLKEIKELIKNKK